MYYTQLLELPHASPYRGNTLYALFAVEYIALSPLGMCLLESFIVPLNKPGMPSRSINDLHPLLAYAFGKAEAEWLIRYPDAPVPFLTCTNRSNDEQNALFNQPTDKKDNDGDGRIDEADERVTNARAGQSAHNYLPSYAFDLGFRNANGTTNWSSMWFVRFAPLVLKTAGITWGGQFSQLLDMPHFEVTGWDKLARK